MPEQLPQGRLTIESGDEGERTERERRFAKALLELISSDIIGTKGSAYAMLGPSPIPPENAERASRSLRVFRERAHELVRSYLGITDERMWDRFALFPLEDDGQ